MAIKYLETKQPWAAASGDNSKDWTPVGSTLGSYADVSYAANVPKTLQLRAGNNSAKEAFISATLRQRLLNVDSELATSTPYDVAVSLTARYTKDLAAKDAIIAAVASLMRTLNYTKTNAGANSVTVLDMLLNGQIQFCCD